MSHIKADAVQEKSTSVGTGDIALAGAMAKMRRFADVLAVGDTCYVRVEGESGGQAENFTGTFNSSGALTRGAILFTTDSGGGHVNFSAGPKLVTLVNHAPSDLEAWPDGAIHDAVAFAVSPTVPDPATGHTNDGTAANTKFVASAIAGAAPTYPAKAVLYASGTTGNTAPKGDTTHLQFNEATNSILLGANGSYSAAADHVRVNAPTGFVVAQQINGSNITVASATGFNPGVDNTFTVGGAAARWSNVWTVGLNVAAAAGTTRPLSFYTWAAGAASGRWQLGANATAEGGSNAGSDFIITRFTDAGAPIDNPLSINRATGNFGFGVAAGSPKLYGSSGVAQTMMQLENSVSDSTLVLNQTAVSGNRSAVQLRKGNVTALQISIEGAAASAGLSYYEATGTGAEHRFYAAGTAVAQILPAGVRPFTTNALTLGDASHVWSNVYATLGQFSGTIASTLGTITTSQPAFNATQTWNAGAVTFEAFKINVTRTAAADPSYLMRLQVGGADQFTVDRFGSGIFTGQGFFGGQINIDTGNAIAAGGTQDHGVNFSTTAHYGLYYGSGAPNKVQARGSLYMRSDANATTPAVYFNSDGTATGWLAVGAGVYLPLTGGALTGALTGTSATFSSDLSGYALWSQPSSGNQPTLNLQAIGFGANLNWWRFTNTSDGSVHFQALNDDTSLKAELILRADGRFSRLPLLAVDETQAAAAITSGVLTLNVAGATVFNVTNNANITSLAFQNVQAVPRNTRVRVILTANGTGFTQAWTNVKWPGGTAPTLSTTNGWIDILEFMTNTGGTSWFGTVVGLGYR